MAKIYRHLTYEERCHIYTLKKRNVSQKEIAEGLNVHPSTISREIQRNKGFKGYRYKQAQEKANLRRCTTNSSRRKITLETKEVIKSKLYLQWSPEQISGWLKKENILKAISHETIYKYIWDDKRRSGTLFKQLRHNGKKYNKRSKGRAGRGCIPNRVDIDKRPKVVEEKSKVGDWEVDTIIGKNHQSAIVSLVERKTKLTKLIKVDRKTSEEVEKAIIRKMQPIQHLVLTITSDNGKEFSNHERVSKILEIDFYFAKPYHSWERGLNEHTNGLVRQYFPKSTSFKEVTQDQLDKVEKVLNGRPRKVLKYRTPIEVFNVLSQGTRKIALRS